MEDVPLSLLIIIGASILLSALFSSAEAAYAAVSKVRLRGLVDENKSGSKKALYIVENFDNAFHALLVGRLLVQIAAAVLTAKLLLSLLAPLAAMLIGIFGLAALLLVFGEMIPRAIAIGNPETYALRISGLLLLLIRLLAPVYYVPGLLKEAVARMFAKGENPSHSVTEDEIKDMVEQGEEEGVIDKEERELIHRSLDFNEVTVDEVLTPRPDMIAVEAGMPVEQIKDVFLRERYSRIPVYDKDIDNIIGILSERDFFAALLQKGDADVRILARKPKFVVESLKISVLLLELQKSNVHMSIVIDEFGGTSGLITLEDILEQLVGDIWDEHDEVVELIVPLGDGVYEVSPQMPLDDFAKEMNVKPIESSFHNLGGWIFGTLDRIPLAGDTFDYEHVRLTVTEVEKKRIKRVRVESIKESGEAAAASEAE